MHMDNIPQLIFENYLGGGETNHLMCSLIDGCVSVCVCVRVCWWACVTHDNNNTALFLVFSLSIMLIMVVYLCVFMCVCVGGNVFIRIIITQRCFSFFLCVFVCVCRWACVTHDNNKAPKNLSLVSGAPPHCIFTCRICHFIQ